MSVVIPTEVAEGVANLIRYCCTRENNFRYFTNMTIGEFNYKISIMLEDVDEVKEARISTITIKRED